MSKEKQLKRIYGFPYNKKSVSLVTENVKSSKENMEALSESGNEIECVRKNHFKVNAVKKGTSEGNVVRDNQVPVATQ